MNLNKSLKGRIDWIITLVPFFSIILLCLMFFLHPDESGAVIGAIRQFFGDDLGLYYLVFGLGVFFVTIYMAFSRFGAIRLGGDRPQYSLFKWGSMMFTAGLAADILFYSLCEWMIYASEPHVQEMGGTQEWLSAYSLFHWGPIPWAFYMALAVAFGFMLHVRNRHKHKYSEACRPLLGARTDGWAGKLVDMLAVFALIAGTATTFSVSAPLLSSAAAELFRVEESTALTIALLLVICAVYTVCAYIGISGVSWLAASCTWLFFALLLFVLCLGGLPRYILETGFSAIGNVAQNFIALCTYTDPLRENSFPQNWTIFYWAYWMVWCVATPFFIGSISRGRTVRQVVLGGYLCGLSGTWMSFIVLGNYGMGMQFTGRADFLSLYRTTQNLYASIIEVLKTLPLYHAVLVLLAITMIAFYATSFDSIALVASAYSYKSLRDGEEPDRRVKLFWSILLILLPIALLFSESSMANLQSVSIIAAFPIGIVMAMIIAAFFKDADLWLAEQREAAEHAPSSDTKKERGQ